MLHVFSTNRVKIVTRTPTTTIFKGRREYTTNNLENYSENV
jgi:hypothetical protein